jgi:hypothetical protein
MLAASGLTFEDVTARVYAADDAKTVFQARAFFPGTVDQYGAIDPAGDDAIIAYYDIDGLPVTYELKDKKGNPTGKKREFFRVRWQHPSEHLDKDGKAAKYKTPYGAGTPMYIPERLRKAYRENRSIERLFIQEGEKKAEKACKHGMLSVAVSGIQNIGMGGRLPEDVIKIIQRCGVKEVVFLLDADCFELSANLKIGDNVLRRPRSFFCAVRSYKEYFQSLRNRDLYVEIYFGHVIKNEAGDKGVDDLLANSLAGREQELIDDLEFAANEKSHAGKYVQLYKVTSMTEHKLEEIWSLHSSAAFAERYRDVLKDMPEFTVGRHRWKFSPEGKLESAQPVEPDEKYWIEKEGAKGKKYLEFRYGRCFKFLQNRGFGRYLRPSGDFCLIRLEKPFVRTVEPWEVRDFVLTFSKIVISDEEVCELLYRGGPQYLGPDKLSHLDFIQPSFEPPARERHTFFFEKSCWLVTAEAITNVEYFDVHHHVWADVKKSFPAALLPPLVSVSRNAEGKFSCTLTEHGQMCHYLRFLQNASNFTWRKERLIREGRDGIVIADEERYDNTLHLVAKLCAIGYMVAAGKNRSAAKAVVGMDGMQSEVGASNGRSGKGLIGDLLKLLIPTCYLNGKGIDIKGDRFVWDELTERHRCVVIDDTEKDFNFEMLFANITGDWNVNYKGGRRCTFPFATSPKIYISTNHAIRGEGSSFRDRQWLLAFSDYYNENHRPPDDFGLMFFDEWDFEQWNLTWNLIAQCVQLYLRYGCVESPSERLEARRLRQSVGEELLSWAEEYFSDPSRRNTPIPRSDMRDSFLAIAPDKRRYYTPSLFKKKIVAYCALKGYKFNPHKYDPATGAPYQLDKDGKPFIDDKRHGVEYFTVGDENFAAAPDATDDEESVLQTPF